MSSPTIYESDFVGSDMTSQSAQTESRNAHNPSAVAESGHRDLVIFTGTHKTGSTALHRYLAANRQALAGLGVRYEITGFEGGFFGNGQSLFNALFLQQPNTVEVDNKLEEYVARSERAICASRLSAG